MAKQVTVTIQQASIAADAVLVRVYRSPDDVAYTEVGTIAVPANPAQFVDRGPSDLGLGDGDYYYKAAQEDAEANLSAMGASAQVTIDTTAPGAPIIASLVVGDFTP